MRDEIIKNLHKISTYQWVKWGYTCLLSFALALISIIIYTKAVLAGKDIPTYLFSLVAGLLVGTIAYMIDGLSHRALEHIIPDKEKLVHHFIVFAAGFPLWISLVLAYWFPQLMPISIMLFILQAAYVGYDEFVFHWDRAIAQEQVVHFLLITGIGALELTWFYWAYIDHYTGLLALF